MRRALLVALAVTVALSGCVAVDAPAPDAGGGSGDAPDGDLTVEVLRVVDGDTIKVAYENGTEDTVRLVGVDTPEVHAENTPDEFEGVPETGAGRDCLGRWGEKASAFAKEELSGATVELAFDANLDRRGYYGRLLAYVVVDGQNFNRQLVDEGYARVYDSEFTEKSAFLDAERAARESGTGLWECATEKPPSATATGTTTASASGLAVKTVHADAEGNDNENLNDEYVTFVNRGDSSLDLSGWTVTDEAGKEYTVPDGVTLAAGAAVTLHTGSGSDGSGDLYWGQGGAVWNNGGDTVTVRDANGDVVLRYEYGG